MLLSRGDRDLGVAFQTHPGRQAFISSGSKEARSALESRRVSLGAHWVDSRESSLLRRLERGREIVEVLGRMPEYRTSTGYCVTPVVGWAEPPLEYRPDPNEVDDVFEVPLAFLLDPRNHR